MTFRSPTNVRISVQERDDEFANDPRKRRAARKCLSCDQMFVSAHCGNRLCPVCSGSGLAPDYSLGARIRWGT